MKKYILSILALAAITFVGCEKNDIDDVVVSDVKGQVINFGAGALESRTIYESTDSKQIHWQTGDMIRIYCDKAIGGQNNVQTSGAKMAYADYVVTVDESDKSYATIALATTTGNNPLLWGETGVAHKFYAVYPHDAATDVAADGTVTFPINRNQICYIQTADEKAADADASKYTYVARPDMSNAYMVAEQTENPSEFGGNDEDKHKNVWLDFKPIMTTINVVVKGPQNLNLDGTPDENNTLSEVMTGVSLVSKIYTNSTASKDEFYYKIAGENSGITAGGSTSTGTKDWQSETTFVTLINQDTGLGGLTLSTNQTLCITAFLPPMAVKTAGDLQREVAVRVHTTGGNKTMTLEDATALIPSAKGAIKLPAMYTPITGSNWITPLDNNIYVSQLSIPGAHDAATGKGTSLAEVGQTQAMGIAEQWDRGIRCFDLRPALTKSGKKLDIYHGYTITDYTFDGAIQEILEKLNDNPGEFAIVLFKHEDENGLLNLWAKDTNGWAAAIGKYLYDLSVAYPERVCTNFKKDMTIGELRGKILFLSRTFYNYSSVDTIAEGNPAANKNPIGAWASPWGDNVGGNLSSWPLGYRTNLRFNEEWNDGATVPHPDVADDYETGKTSPNAAIVYMQDYYSGINADQKIFAAVNLLEKSAQFHTDDNLKNDWAINHFSGYTGNNLGSTSAYMVNAQNICPTLYQYMLGNEITLAHDGSKRTKPVGSTGIVLFDWVGADVWDKVTLGTIYDAIFGSGDFSYTTYGGLLPQTIIDNNYKYRMKRKGE